MAVAGGIRSSQNNGRSDDNDPGADLLIASLVLVGFGAAEVPSPGPEQRTRLGGL